MKNRKIELSSINNIRTLGGMKTADGSVIREKTIFRSACLVSATDEDMERLNKEHGIDLVIDLRTAEEIIRRPDRRSESIQYLPKPVFTEKLLGLTHEDDPADPVNVARIPAMENIYRMIADNPECGERLSEIITTIAEHDYDKGAVLWHCTEGKDRCGIISALVLTMLNVSREDIMEDYLITNDVNRPKAEAIYQNIIDEGNDPAFAEAVRKAFLAEPSYLNAAFDVMEEKSGSLYAYVTDCLKVPEATISAFRKQILL